MKNWNRVFIPLAALLVGACIGYWANNAILRARIRQWAPGTDIARKIVDSLSERVSLTPEQDARVYELFTAYDARFAEQREAHRAAIDAIREELDAELDAMLTPEQVAERHRYIEEIRARHAANPPPPPPRR